MRLDLFRIRLKLYAAMLSVMLVFRVAEVAGWMPGQASAAVLSTGPLAFGRLVYSATVFKPRPLLVSHLDQPLTEADVAAATLLLEAVGEGYRGMIAVGEVIRNRAIASGRSFGDVCLMPYQFSAWNDVPRAQNFLSENKRYLALAMRAWHASARTFMTHGATYYHADYVNPYWAADYRRVATIGRHIFYSSE